MIKINLEDQVKERSVKKYNCKKNKGEHEWGEPIIKYQSVRYTYKTNMGILDSDSLYKDKKLEYAKIGFMYEVFCKHCNKKNTGFLSNKLN